MSLWMLLLIVLLTVTSVLFFSFSMSATVDSKNKKRYRIIATIALVAAVGLVILGVMRGRKAAAVMPKRGKRVKFENNNNNDFNNYENDEFNFSNDEFLDDFDDLPRPPGIDKPGGAAPTTDATALLAT